MVIPGRFSQDIEPGNRVPTRRHARKSVRLLLAYLKEHIAMAETEAEMLARMAKGFVPHTTNTPENRTVEALEHIAYCMGRLIQLLEQKAAKA
jgi:hypothetical protein